MSFTMQQQDVSYVSQSSVQKQLNYMSPSKYGVINQQP